MLIIVGLGNSGDKFKNTRHNTGFMAVDFFALKNNFPDFKLSKKFNSFISRQIINKSYSDNSDDRQNYNSVEILLVKPQTFMNNSGTAVKKITKSYSLKSDNLIVIHDDIDLALGTLKIVKNRGSAGHKGVESIIKAVGNKNIVRFRLGIKPIKGKPKNPENFVVKNINREELNIINETIEKTYDALCFLIESGLEKTMNEYNQ